MFANPVYVDKEHFHFYLQYKHSGAFANRKYGEMEKLFECRGPRNTSYPKNQKMCYPILVTLLKMRPHYS